MRDSDSNKLRPIDAFVKYFLDVKPYHTKLLEVVERYKFAEDITVNIAESVFTGVSIRNNPLCKVVGFGLIFDECGFSNDSCCDLFQCLGGYGVIWDNSDLIGVHSIDSINTTTDEIEIQGNFTFDRRLEILKVEQNSLTLRGDHTLEFLFHKLFLIAPFNVYSIASAQDNTLSIVGDIAFELNLKREIKVTGTAGRDGLFGVHTAIYNPATDITTVTVAGNANFNVGVTGAYIETESQPRNQGFYQVDRAELVNGDTVVFLKAGTTFPVQTFVNNGSVQLRTALSAPRRVWLADSTSEGEVEREYRVADAFYNATTDKTHIVLADQLFTGETYNEIRLHGYMTSPGFDGDEECDAPKPTNVHAVIGEHLVLRVIPRPILAVTPTPTSSLAVTPTPTSSPLPMEDYFAIPRLDSDNNNSMVYGLVGLEPDIAGLSVIATENLNDAFESSNASGIISVEQVGNRIFSIFDSNGSSRLRITQLSESGELETVPEMEAFFQNYVDGISAVRSMGGTRAAIVGNFSTGFNTVPWAEQVSAATEGLFIVDFDETKNSLSIVGYATANNLGDISKVAVFGNYIVTVSNSLTLFELVGSELLIRDDIDIGDNYAYTFDAFGDGYFVLTSNIANRIYKLRDGKLFDVCDIGIPNGFNSYTTPAIIAKVTADNSILIHDKAYGGYGIHYIQFDPATETTVYNGYLAYGFFAGDMMYSHRTQRLYLPKRHGTAGASGAFQWDDQAKTLTAIVPEFGSSTEMFPYGHVLLGAPLSPVSAIPTPTPSPTDMMLPTPTPSSTMAALGTSGYKGLVMRDNPKYFWTLDENNHFEPVQGDGHTSIFYDMVNRRPLTFSNDFENLVINNSYSVGGTGSLFMAYGYGPLYRFRDNELVMHQGQDYTFEYWMFPATTNSVDNRYTNVMTVGKNQIFGIGREAGQFVAYDYATTVPCNLLIGDWNHVVVVIRGDRTCSFYLNGERLIDGVLEEYGLTIPFSPEFLSAGYWYQTCLWSTFISQIAFYEHALSDSQIATHYSVGDAAKVIDYRRPEESAKFALTAAERAAYDALGYGNLTWYYDMPRAVTETGEYYFTAASYGPYDADLLVYKRNSIDNTWSKVSTVTVTGISIDTCMTNSDGTRVVCLGTTPNYGNTRGLVFTKGVGDNWSITCDKSLSQPYSQLSGIKVTSDRDLTKFAFYQSNYNLTNGVYIFNVTTSDISAPYLINQADITIPVTIYPTYHYVSWCQFNRNGDELMIGQKYYGVGFASFTYNGTDWVFNQRIKALHDDGRPIFSARDNFAHPEGGVYYGGLSGNEDSGQNVQYVSFSYDDQFMAVMCANAWPGDMHNNSIGTYGKNVLLAGHYVVVFKKVSGVWTHFQTIDAPTSLTSNAYFDGSLLENNEEYNCVRFADNGYRLVMGTENESSGNFMRAFGDGVAYIYEMINGAFVYVDMVYPSKQYTSFHGFAHDAYLTNNGTVLIAVSVADALVDTTAGESIHDLDLNDLDGYFDSGFTTSVLLPEDYSQTYNQRIDKITRGGDFLGPNTLKPIHHFTFDSAANADRIGSSSGQLTGSAIILNDTPINGKVLKVTSDSSAGFVLDEPIQLPNTLSVDFWLKLGPPTGDYRTIIGFDSDYSICVNLENKIEFRDNSAVQRNMTFTRDNGTFEFASGDVDAVISEGSWVHVLIKNDVSNVAPRQWNRSSEHYKDLFTVYVNGRVMGQWVANTKDKVFTHIGTNADGQVLSGEISDLVIFNYNIDAIDLYSRYKASLSEMYITQTPLPQLSMPATPVASVTPTVTKTPTPTPSVTRSPAAGVTPTPTPSNTRTVTPTPTVTPTLTVTPTNSPTTSITPTITPTVSVSSQITGTYFNAVMRSNPTDYWTFADRPMRSFDGANTYEYTNSANSNNRVIIQNYEDDATGFVSGRAVHVKSDVRMAVETLVDIFDNYSIEAWVYLHQMENPSDVRQIFTSSDPNLGLRIVNGKLKGPADTNSGASTAIVPIGAWTHVVLVVDKSLNASGAGYKYYVNGTLAMSKAAPVTGSISLGHIGHNGGTEFLNGLLDELAVYHHPLTAGEVLAHYQSVQATVAPTPTPTITVTRTVTPTPTNTRTPTPTPTATRTPTPTPSPTLSVGASPTASPLPFSQQYAAAVLADSPVHFWKFNGGYTDSVGTNHGTLVTNASSPSNGLSAAGIDGSSLYLTRISSNYYANERAGVTLAQSFNFVAGTSIEFWVNPHRRLVSGSSARPVLAYADASYGGVWLNSIDLSNPESPMLLQVHNVGYTQQPPSIPYYEWTHIVITLESSSSGTVYVNGVPRQSFSAVYATSRPIQMIGESLAFNGSFDGHIDAVACYNTVLSEQQVLNHFNIGNYALVTPAASPTPTPTMSQTPTPTVTPTISVTPSVTRTMTPTPSPTLSLGASPTPTPADAGAIYAATVMASGPLHYWKFNTENPVDATGNGNDLTMFDDSASGAVSLVEDDGIGGKCALIRTDFDYNNNRGFTLATDIVSADHTSGYTMEGWINLIDPGDSDYYVALIGDKNNGKGFEMWISGTAQDDIFEYYFYGANANTVSPSYVDLPSRFGQWTHIAMTVDENGIWKMYQNGVEVLNGDNAIPMTFGFVGTDSSYEMMDGKLDEVAFYSRVLPEAEIMDHYTVGVAALGG